MAQGRLEEGVAAAVAAAVRERPDLVSDTRRHRPKAWGELAALGVLTFRRSAGRPATYAERRAIWAGLWRVVEGGPGPD